MQLTLLKAIFCGLFWIMMFVFYEFRLNHRSSLFIRRNNGYLLLFILLSVYAVLDYTGGDYFGYFNLYQYSKLYGTTFHMEPVYGWLIRHTGNYYCWRFLVWGSSVMLWVLIIKKLKLDVDYSALMFLLLVFYNFVGGRQTVGFCLMFYGLVIMLHSDRHKFICLLLGLAIFMCSWFFHRTMMVYCIVSLMAMIPFRKWGIYVLLLMFPFLFYGFNGYISDFVDIAGGFSEDRSARMQYYLDSDFRAVSNINGVIRMVIERLPVFLFLGVSTYNILIKNNKQPFIYETLLRMAFLLVYFSYLFMGQDVSAYIAPRFWDASLFPMTIFVSYYMFERRGNTFVKTSTILLVFAKLFHVCYEVYAL